MSEMEQTNAAKVFKLSCYIIDTDNELTKEELEIFLENSYGLDEYIIEHVNIEERVIKNWSWDYPGEEYEKYFI